MILGKNNIISWFEELNVPYWALFYKGKTESGNPIKRSSQADNVTPSDALSELQKTLGYIDRGQYTIMAGEKANLAIRGNCRVDFEIPYQEGHPQNILPMPQISGLPQTVDEMEALADKRAQKMLEKFKLEQKVELLEKENRELKKENQELEKEAGSGTNKFFNAISGIGVDKILGAFMNKPTVAISGVPHSEGPEENDQDYSIRLSKVLEIFQKYDPDWMNTLEKMANKVQSNPAIIDTIKMML